MSFFDTLAKESPKKYQTFETRAAKIQLLQEFTAFSTGMRRGIRAVPQSQDNFLDLDDDGAIEYACALGAVALGSLTVDERRDLRRQLKNEDDETKRFLIVARVQEYLLRKYPNLLGTRLFVEGRFRCPAYQIDGSERTPCDEESRSLGSLIPHLNDEHNWTRGRILTYVESLLSPHL